MFETYTKLVSKLSVTCRKLVEIMLITSFQDRLIITVNRYWFYLSSQ